MRDLLLTYWYVPALLSTLYTAASVAWSIRIERRIRAHERMLFSDSLRISTTMSELEDLQRYLEKCPTERDLEPALPVIEYGTVIQLRKDDEA